MKHVMDGLYGLFSLNGSPVNEQERFLLTTQTGSANVLRWSHPTASLCLISTPSTGQSGIFSTGNSVLALLGDLEHPATLADKLSEPKNTPVPELLFLAWRRWGDDAFKNLTGEWSIVVWHAKSLQLSIATSLTRRDHVFIAQANGRVAIAPQIYQLSQYSWVKSAFDPAGLLLSMGRWAVRNELGDKTFLKHVRHANPHTTYRIKMDGTHVAPHNPPTKLINSNCTFDEAVEAVEHAARASVRQKIQTQKSLAVFLSGGLDSTSLAWLATVEKRADQPLFAIASVAPKNSGITDERYWIDLAAQSLGLFIEYVCPESHVNPFIPNHDFFEYMASPIAGPRHYLYEQLFNTARRLGATAVLDGCYGEMSLTSKNLPKKLPLRQLLSTIMRYVRLMKQLSLPGEIANNSPFFQVKLSASMQEFADSELLKNDLSEDFALNPSPEKNLTWFMKATLAATSVPGGELRQLYPFRDWNLVALVASLPTEYKNHCNTPRAYARGMLQGHVPNELRLRTTKGAFSPDYIQRLQKAAPETRPIMRQYSKGAAAQWLDFHWLDQALLRLSHAPQSLLYQDLILIQSTCQAAAFFDWWDIACHTQKDIACSNIPHLV